MGTSQRTVKQQDQLLQDAAESQSFDPSTKSTPSQASKSECDSGCEDKEPDQQGGKRCHQEISENFDEDANGDRSGKSSKDRSCGQISKKGRCCEADTPIVEDNKQPASKQTSKESPSPSQDGQTNDASDIAESKSSEMTEVAAAQESPSAEQKGNPAAKEEESDQNGSSPKEEGQEPSSAAPVKQQLHDMSVPHEHDVLSGRGNFVNNHPGNEFYRKLVQKYKVNYVECPKPQKGFFSHLIVNEVLARDPPGRFLKQDPRTNLWNDIGKKKALNKTRQALREGAPEITKELSYM